MTTAGVGRARAIQVQGMLDVLRHIHLHPWTPRADLARQLGLSRSTASEITGRLREADLVAETDATPTGGRGRPTRVLGPHPRGPVVAAVGISHESWRLTLAPLGGDLTAVASGRHRRRPDSVLARVAGAVAGLGDDLGPRLRGIGVSVPGTVSDGRLVQASTLGWGDVDIHTAMRAATRAATTGDAPVVIGNDATLAGVAEARRGAASQAGVALHLSVEVGIGGVLIDHGRAVTGSTGAGGEFGHLPFGDPARQCPCGAYGCWDLDIDGRALARHLGSGEPADPRTVADAVVAAARAGDAAAVSAVEQVARSLGRGIGGLVNALDPQVVTVAGLAASILDTAQPAVDDAYLTALMRFRRAVPPPVLRARFPADGSLRGAADLAFDRVLSEAGLAAWRDATVPR